MSAAGMVRRLFGVRVEILEDGMCRHVKSAG